MNKEMIEVLAAAVEANNFQAIPEILEKLGFGSAENQMVSTEGVNFLRVKLPTSELAATVFMHLPAEFNYLEREDVEAAIKAAEGWDVHHLARLLYHEPSDFPVPFVATEYAPDGKPRCWMSYSTSSGELELELNLRRSEVVFRMHRVNDDGSPYFAGFRAQGFLSGLVRALRK